MDQEFTPAVNLQEVQQRFDGWRAQRKRGTPIPASLWEDAVSLCAGHSLSKVSSALRLDYNVLKKRLQLAFPDRFSHSAASYVQSMPPSDFIAVDLSPTLPEFIMDMERAGKRMRIHIKGTLDFQPLELMKTFWGRG